MTTPEAGRRRYDSPVRRQRAAETRQRIVAAGSELVHELSSWDWRELTFRAVAERAGVGERTVYRHFPTERHLREAVMKRLHEESGVDYDHVQLATLTSLTRRILTSLESFSVGRSVVEPDDPTFHAIDDHRRAALLQAVAVAAPHWSETQQTTAAGVLDVIWNVPSYERLVAAWQFDTSRAVDAVCWAIDLVVAAIDGDRPPTED
jgi:AcrR family transcriptional regulator